MRSTVTSKAAIRMARSRHLTEHQIRVIQKLYKLWAQEPNKKITLAEELNDISDSLVILGLIRRFQPRRGGWKAKLRELSNLIITLGPTNRDRPPTYQITKKGRRRYEETHPNKAAETRKDCGKSDSMKHVLRMLRALGYAAERSGKALTITQDGAEHILSHQEVGDLIACPQKHPLSLSQFMPSEAGKFPYSFPEGH